MSLGCRSGLTTPAPSKILLSSLRIDGQSLRGKDVMKRATSVLGTLLFFALVSPAVASESFILNIPVRGNANQETGEGRLALGPNPSPAAAQLGANGHTTVTLVGG